MAETEKNNIKLKKEKKARNKPKSKMHQKLN